MSTDRSDDLTPAAWPALEPPLEGARPAPQIPTGVTRASDADREHVARILRAAAGEGMLTLDEADERLAVVYAARYRDELSPLTLDLPNGGEHLLANTAEARAAARTGLTRHIITVVVVASLLVAAWWVSDVPFFWPAWPLAFMAFSVWAHARRIGRPWGGRPWGGPGGYGLGDYGPSDHGDRDQDRRYSRRRPR